MRYRAVQYALPGREVTNDDVIREVIAASRPHLTPGELDSLPGRLQMLFRASGTAVRYQRAPGERAVELTVSAGEKALAAASMQPEEIDLLIYVGIGRGFLEPATANVFQDLLRLRNATCFDILDACASWLRALHVARAFIAGGVYRNVMVVNGEFNYAEYADPALHSLDELDFKYPTFTMGEAATATILSASSDDDDYFCEFRTRGDHRKLCMIPLPNHEEYGGAGCENPVRPLRFYSWGDRIMTAGLMGLAEQYASTAAIREFDPDVIFTHAASDVMSRRLMRICGLDGEKAFLVHRLFGNTVPASVPLAMALAAEEGRLRAGSRVLFAFASAGLSSSWCRFRYLT